jgi:hypothetical protein
MSAPVENLLERLHAKRSGKGWIAKCPAHDDGKPSLRVNEGADGRALVKCWAGCTLEAVLSAIGLTTKDLFPAGAFPKPSGNGQPQPSTSTATPFDWKKYVENFTEKHIKALAKWRGYSIEFCRWLKENRLVGLYNAHIAFPVHDHAGNVVAIHYRLKDSSWRYHPQGTKARPLVIGELVAGERVQCFESTWDGLDYLDKSGEREGVIITRGAGNAKFAEVVPSNCPLYVWTQNDEAGQQGERTICADFKGTIKRVKIPAPHKDLNDWTRAGATSDDLLAAMLSAEIIREAEKSWTDALNESVVTANELAGLELRPRKKLLGDWFCEGDLGFIFAFRGVGKTWFALAIAQAVSKGGKLGDWQAHERVKVLYIDGEMPADLMRDRCSGLEGDKQ